MKNHDEPGYLYLGCFVDEAGVARLYESVGNPRLERVIGRPHVTLAYKPDVVDERLFGQTVRMVAIGYANNEDNEAVLVQLVDPGEVIARLVDAHGANPHITLSVSRDAQPVESGKLSFTSIDPINLTSTVGGVTKGGVLVLTAPDKDAQTCAPEDASDE